MIIIRHFTMLSSLNYLLAYLQDYEKTFKRALAFIRSNMIRVKRKRKILNHIIM